MHSHASSHTIHIILVAIYYKNSDHQCWLFVGSDHQCWLLVCRPIQQIGYLGLMEVTTLNKQKGVFK